MSEKRKRVLQVNIDNNGGTGAFTLVRYLYSFLKDQFVFDYYTLGKFIKDRVYEDIVAEGGRCISVNLRKHKLIGHIILPFSFYFFLKNESYEIVHIHSEVAYKQFLYAVAAKCAGINKIIIHSHSSEIDGNSKTVKLIGHKILRNVVNKLGTDFLACSIPAGKWMFTNKTMNSKKFRILHNGINPCNYEYAQDIRNSVREKLKIKDRVVIGHVGALKKVKNQSRLLEIVKEMDDDRFILFLIGDGEDKEKIEKEIEDLKLKEQVKMLGNRTDIAELLQALDVFVFPSFFEGIPMALIEAQATGIPIIASDTINKDIRINDNMVFLSLDEKNTIWCSYIKEYVNKHIYNTGFLNIEKSEYNIENSAHELRNIYNNVKD